MRLALVTSLILIPLFEIFSQNISGNIKSYPFNLPLEEVAVTLKNNQTGDLLGTDSTDINGNYSIDYVIVSVNDKNNLPSNYDLSSAYPNPFNPGTKIDFNAAKHGRFTVKLFSIIGEQVFSNSYDLTAGFYSFAVSGLGSAGVYLFYISGEEFSSVQKLLLLDGGSGNVKVEPANSVSALKKLYYDDLRIEFRKPGYEVKDTVVSWAMNLIVNASLNKLSELRNIKLTAFVEMSAVIVPLRYFTAKLKNDAGTVIQTKQTGDTNFVLFTDVYNLSNYQVEVVSDTSARPNFISRDTTIYLINDTSITIYTVLYLRPTTMDTLGNVLVNEDQIPNSFRLHDLWAKTAGYDSLGNLVNDNALVYVVLSQTDSALASTIIEANQYTKLTGLKPNGNGINNVTIRAKSPNFTFAEKTFPIDVKALADIILNARLLDGTLVVNYKANVKNSSFATFHTQNSGSSSQMILNNMSQTVKQIEILDTDSSNVSFTPFYINFISPYSGDSTLTVFLSKDERKVTLNFFDYFLNTAVNNVYVKTSKEAGTNTGGKQWRAGFNEEKIVANGPAHLRSGIVLAPGSRDTTILHYLVNADVNNQGLDTVYMKGLLTYVIDGGYRGNVDQVHNGKYVGMTPTSIKDTIWIYGLIPPVSEYKFRDVGQLNEIAKVLNDTAKVMTTTKDFPNGLFGVGKRIIAIADSNFNKPDSIAKFLYSNMKVVPQSTAPIDLETQRNYIRIVAGAGTGGNAPDLKEDGLTLKGGFITINYGGSNALVNHVAKEELFSMLLGSVESSISYSSLYDINKGIIFPQDIRRQSFIIYRFNQTGGRQFPDLPPNF